jgi:hypothetical protein
MTSSADHLNNAGSGRNESQGRLLVSSGSLVECGKQFPYLRILKSHSEVPPREPDTPSEFDRRELPLLDRC